MATTTITSSGSWLAPPGTTSVQVSCLGAGSGGVKAFLRGGGGGASAASTVPVTAGNHYPANIGAGGGTSTTGGSTSFFGEGPGTTVLAVGGSNSGFGGLASSCTGTVCYSGGNGGTGDIGGNGAGGGSSAGSAADGSDGTDGDVGPDGAGVGGAAPDGGGNGGNGALAGGIASNGSLYGGGAGSVGGGGTQGVGANGVIILVWVGTDPAVVQVSSPYIQAYNTGDQITVTLTYDQAVTVVGNPYVLLTLTSGTVNCAYSSGSGTNQLVFVYTVQANDFCGSGFVCAGTITLNGGTITNGGHDAALTFTPTGPSGADPQVTVNFAANLDGSGILKRVQGLPARSR